MGQRWHQKWSRNWTTGPFLIFVLNTKWNVLFEGETFGLTTRKWLWAPSSSALFLSLQSDWLLQTWQAVQSWGLSFTAPHSFLILSLSLSISLFLCLSLSLSLCFSLSLGVSFCLCLSVSLRVSPSLCLRASEPCLSLCVSVSLYVSLCFCPSVFVSLCLPLSLSLCVCVCVSVCFSPCVSSCLGFCLSVSLGVPLALSLRLCVSLSVFASLYSSVRVSLFLSVSLFLCDQLNIQTSKKRRKPNIRRANHGWLSGLLTTRHWMKHFITMIWVCITTLRGVTDTPEYYLGEKFLSWPPRWR